jgi:drug/metabolite transporter (DMT)-like permease
VHRFSPPKHKFVVSGSSVGRNSTVDPSGEIDVMPPLISVATLTHCDGSAISEVVYPVEAPNGIGLSPDATTLYWAETHIASGLTAVLFSTMPLMTALLSAFWMRSEMLTVRKVTGILVGIAGTALLFWPQETIGVMQALGMLSTLTGCLCAAINLVVIKRYGRHSDGFVLNFFAMALGALCLLVTSAAFEPWTTVVWTRSNVLAILYLSLFGSVIAFSAYYHLIKRIDATVVSLQTLISPVVALALGRAFLHETVTPAGVVGIVTILSGVGVATLQPGRARLIDQSCRSDVI